MGWLGIIPRVLKYLVTLGPLIYDAVNWGIKIVREFRKPKPVKPVPPIEPPVKDPATKPDLDPG